MPKQVSYKQSRFAPRRWPPSKLRPVHPGKLGPIAQILLIATRLTVACLWIFSKPKIQSLIILPCSLLHKMISKQHDHHSQLELGPPTGVHSRFICTKQWTDLSHLKSNKRSQNKDYLVYNKGRCIIRSIDGFNRHLLKCCQKSCVRV